jgi:hypothetical protein
MRRWSQANSSRRSWVQGEYQPVRTSNLAGGSPANVRSATALPRLRPLPVANDRPYRGPFWIRNPGILAPIDRATGRPSFRQIGLRAASHAQQASLEAKASGLLHCRKQTKPRHPKRRSIVLRPHCFATKHKGPPSGSAPQPTSCRFHAKRQAAIFLVPTKGMGSPKTADRLMIPATR